eukprot:GHVU01089557.1.p1 GENE.GHVU01089557.1~~GHVU01089557.1.p1  ORF type:complete len:150 (-),score=21.96 GHVU01089557.1:135-584(-)
MSDFADTECSPKSNRRPVKARRMSCEAPTAHHRGGPGEILRSSSRRSSMPELVSHRTDGDDNETSVYEVGNVGSRDVGSLPAAALSPHYTPSVYGDLFREQDEVADTAAARQQELTAAEEEVQSLSERLSQSSRHPQSSEKVTANKVSE